MTKLTHAQRIALGTFLHSFADDLDFTTNLAKLVTNGETDSDIIPAEAYEYINREWLAIEIESLADDIQQAIDKGSK